VRHLDPAAWTLRLQARLAAAATAAMGVIAAATAVWWAVVATASPPALTGGPDVGQQSALVPQLVLAMAIMVAATGLAAAGARRERCRPCPRGSPMTTVTGLSAVSAEGLTKRYGAPRGVEDVSFTVSAGQVCALLGRNGAGKTTTMRLLVGLSRSDRGRAWLLGEPVALAAGVLARVGVMIDGPGFVPHLSGLSNLRLLWRTAGRDCPPAALERSLALAGLGPAIKKRRGSGVAAPRASQHPKRLGLD
jgi:ABC-type transport system involved in cytochrome bd biosynthesis fused ATPase/permease subunit